MAKVPRLLDNSSSLGGVNLSGVNPGVFESAHPDISRPLQRAAEALSSVENQKRNLDSIAGRRYEQEVIRHNNEFANRIALGDPDLVDAETIQKEYVKFITPIVNTANSQSGTSGAYIRTATQKQINNFMSTVIRPAMVAKRQENISDLMNDFTESSKRHIMENPTDAAGVQEQITLSENLVESLNLSEAKKKELGRKIRKDIFKTWYESNLEANPVTAKEIVSRFKADFDDPDQLMADADKRYEQNIKDNVTRITENKKIKDAKNQAFYSDILDNFAELGRVAKNDGERNQGHEAVNDLFSKGLINYTQSVVLKKAIDDPDTKGQADNYQTYYSRIVNGEDQDAIEEEAASDLTAGNLSVEQYKGLQAIKGAQSLNSIENSVFREYYNTRVGQTFGFEIGADNILRPVKDAPKALEYGVFLKEFNKRIQKARTLSDYIQAVDDALKTTTFAGDLVLPTFQRNHQRIIGNALVSLNQGASPGSPGARRLVVELKNHKKRIDRLSEANKKTTYDQRFVLGVKGLEILENQSNYLDELSSHIDDKIEQLGGTGAGR